MQLTKESEYALVGLAVLLEGGAPMTLSTVAAEGNLPEAFLARIFRGLARHGILRAKRGPGNGYSLARPSGSITVREIVEAAEGPEVLDRCLLWRERCSEEDPCLLHHRFTGLRSRLEALLEETTLHDYVSESLHAPAAKERKAPDSPT